MPAPLLTLPDDLLIKILVAVGDVWDLPAIALTCRRLAGLVYGDEQTLWRELHAERYDNPFQASAFFQPRTKYPWRTEVIERNVVARYIENGMLSAVEPRNFWVQQYLTAGLQAITKWGFRAGDFDDDKIIVNESNYKQVEEEALRWGPRIFRVAYGLSVDMPPRGGPDSRNAEELSDLLQSDTFRIAAAAAFPVRIELGSDGMESISGPLRPHSDLARSAALAYAIGGAGMEFPIRQYAEVPVRRNWQRRPMGGFIDWQEGLRTSQTGPLSFVYEPHAQGDGLLNLPERPLCGQGHVWDWADVRGEWLTFYQGRLVGGHRPPAVLSETMISKSLPLYYRRQAPRNDLPLSFEAVPVASRADVNTAFSKLSTKQVDLWSQFPAEPAPRLSVPPLYFHSTGKLSPFVYGMVSLSADEPPELEWIFAVCHAAEGRDEKREDFIMRGVQYGGRGSALGVRGPYGPRSWGPRGQLHSSFPNIAWDPTMVSAEPNDAFHAYGTANFTKAAWLGDDDANDFRDTAQDQYSALTTAFGGNDAQYHLGFNGNLPAPDSLVKNWFLDEVDNEDWDVNQLRPFLNFETEFPAELG